MSFSNYNIKKWTKMLLGRSVLHVRQDIGTLFQPNELKGYFNDLTLKVLKQPIFLQRGRVPTVKTEKGEQIYFPVAIFQYGLGIWDLYLKNGDPVFRKMFLVCSDWALENQEPCGAWNNFFYVYPETPFGAMAQGEAASLLVRAWKLTNDKKYLSAAQKAIEFMLISTEDGGTTKYFDDKMVLLEYTNLPAVLNGWVFSLFGIYDLNLALSGQYSDVLAKALNSLSKTIHEFDNGYWSKYDLGAKLASPFYHNLHIAQLRALYCITNDNVFRFYADRFMKYRKNKIKYFCAFFNKAVQKIKE